MISILVRAYDGVEVGDLVLYEVGDDEGARRVALTSVNEHVLPVRVRYEEGVAMANVNGGHAQRGRGLSRG